MKIVNLDKIKLKDKVIVESLECSGDFRRRLLDLGICKGTTITPIFRSITKDSTAYLVRGATIALRKQDAQNIKVIYN